ncbi:hypothetical protein [uncultured Algimonas sp.]|uniref:hypothetical protein n=1 Tax=uncultured Algimonas sp. TaxID=1547920 RepID=UPI00262DF1E4|nr:hypothetical protein [uncultured Algimonas sp.]
MVDPLVADWQFDGFAWLIDHFSTGPGLPGSELWRPVPEHFPAAPGDLAAHLFEIVRRQYGFADHLLFEPVAVDVLPTEPLDGGGFIESDAEAACATYQRLDRDGLPPRELIYYDEAMGATDLVATFAHELAHAAHQRAPEWAELNVPGSGLDLELYELFTDLTAVYFGYGLFLANTRHDVVVGANGWAGADVFGAGYLPENDLVFATALFMSLKGIPEGAAVPHLKPRLRKTLNRAFRQLDRERDRIRRLRARRPAHGPDPDGPRLGDCLPEPVYPFPEAGAEAYSAGINPAGMSVRRGSP